MASAPSSCFPPNGGRLFGWRETTVVASFAGSVTVAVWLTLPATVITFTDDFGYLRSVVETLQQGRPWTNDWLEPWAASLSVLSAVIYKLSGSFRLAIYGLLAVLAGVSVWGLARLLCDRGMSPAVASGWSLACLAVPTMLWKFSEFGAMPLYVACLLIAIRGAERGRWAVFAAAWLVAASSRQSALGWLALPVGIFLERAWNGQLPWKVAGARSAAVGIGGALVYGCLQAAMNRTHAQTVAPAGMFTQFATPLFWRNLALGGGLLATAAGLGGFVLSSGSNAETPQANMRRAAAIATGVVVAAFWTWDLRNVIEFEHPYWRENAGGGVFHCLFLLSMLGWWFDSLRLRSAHVFAALGMAGLVALRGVPWEYYFVDLGVLGFLAARGSPVPTAGRGRGRRMAGFVALVVLLILEGRVAGGIKRLLDQNLALVTLCEQSLRAGTIEPEDLAVAPFGFQGWQLYPYYVANDGAHGGYIADFVNYLRPEALRLVVAGRDGPVLSTENGQLRPGEILVSSHVSPWQWTQVRRFNLIRQSASNEAALALVPGRYSRPWFPLNDEEWRRLIGGQSAN